MSHNKLSVKDSIYCRYHTGVPDHIESYIIKHSFVFGTFYEGFNQNKINLNVTIKPIISYKKVWGIKK